MHEVGSPLASGSLWSQALRQLPCFPSLLILLGSRLTFDKSFYHHISLRFSELPGCGGASLLDYQLIHFPRNFLHWSIGGNLHEIIQLLTVLIYCDDNLLLPFHFILGKSSSSNTILRCSSLGLLTSEIHRTKRSPSYNSKEYKSLNYCYKFYDEK